ncbi:type II and III secretion system protein family protein [Inquilinus sp. Marseille-Q2685]|uniref:type II and III secretion system protein family protein n=1 Tax=Inquilinus sp. Marseille-Q2685 TaxID=2866581 RepID=UPI001CE3C472|nr:type II and III secretion system protein family protein [Inquilinus sp. Marseille-Q2685]
MDQSRSRLRHALAATVVLAAAIGIPSAWAQAEPPGMTVQPLPPQAQAQQTPAAPGTTTVTPTEDVTAMRAPATAPKIVTRPPGAPAEPPPQATPAMQPPPAPGQPAPTMQVSPAPPRQPAQPALTPSRSLIEMKVGQGNLLTFALPVQTVLVANPNVLDVEMVSARSAYIYGVSSGTTNLFALSSADQVVAAANVRVSQDAAAAQREMMQVAPAAGGQMGYIQDRPVTTGTVADLGSAMKLDALAQQLGSNSGGAMNLNTLQGSQQVGIRVRFAEVQRNAVENLGVNWQAMFDIGKFNIGLVSGGFAGVGLPGTANAGYHSGGNNVDAVIDALQREGLVNILAEPTLTAVSGETANFLAGGEFPIPVPQGNETVTVEYKQFGVSLSFVPTVLPGERIAMRVKPEVSELSDDARVENGSFSIPSLIVRRAETTVELASGQTFALAGMFQRNMSNVADKIPVLGDVPILGKLFQSSRYKRNETELVILITPYLMKPAESPKAVAVPAQRTEPTVRRVRQSPSMTGGSAGFVLE